MVCTLKRCHKSTFETIVLLYVPHANPACTPGSYAQSERCSWHSRYRDYAAFEGHVDDAAKFDLLPKLDDVSAIVHFVAVYVSATLSSDLVHSDSMRSRCPEAQRVPERSQWLCGWKRA